VIVYAKQDAGEARPRPVGEWLKGFRTYSGRGVITSRGSLNTVATVWEVFAYTEMMQRESVTMHCNTVNMRSIFRKSCYYDPDNHS